MENIQLKLYIKPPRHSSSKQLQAVLVNRKLEALKVSSRSPSINSLNTSIKSDDSRPRSSSQRRKRYHSQSTIPKVSASSWCIVDKSSGTLIYGHNDGEIREIASLTKIMTCIVAINLIKNAEKSTFDTKVKISQKASSMIGTSAELQPNDELTIKSLLYGLMLPSGNDAAWALAEFFGSKIAPQSRKPVKRFIGEMNKTGREIGLISTHFANPHGLVYKKNLSSARDVAKLACYAMKNEIFKSIVATRVYVAEIRNLDGNVRLQNWENTNKLLGKGFDGVKTGITNAAGPCLCVSSSKEPNVLIVLLNSKSMEDRWVEAKKLHEWASLKYF